MEVPSTPPAPHHLERLETEIWLLWKDGQTDNNDDYKKYFVNKSSIFQFNFITIFVWKI